MKSWRITGGMSQRRNGGRASGNFKMPGRSSANSGSTGFISFSGIESALSSLKNFQSCISSGMDTVSSVALDLVETQTEVSSEYSMDKAMVEFAMMDRELNHYIKAVQSAINHVKEERPENIPDLKLLVEKKFLALQNKNSDADFQKNEKFVQFKQQLKELKKQYGQQADRETEGPGVDEDMIVTQSQINFICPITQLEMKKPVKNKVCGHTYEEEAIVRMIESKHKRKKKAWMKHCEEQLKVIIRKDVVSPCRAKPAAPRAASSLPLTLAICERDVCQALKAQLHSILRLGET
ncbi:PREDICTED: E3 SUMO-protein ligase NSE2 isoform X1 [Dipodomys ordii]|uniref:E3 SUMO-protein ligase NSE2 n=2 Tax=Dipodomys ordii TaxID=10020 RepID=A0A1S3FVS8_DIPOR|nr:PREDICTED: E3 SUMO-protein ligase NSE2 isoform X1 [Dipodomys ordii]